MLELQVDDFIRWYDGVEKSGIVLYVLPSYVLCMYFPYMRAVEDANEREVLVERDKIKEVLKLVPVPPEWRG